MAYKCSLIHISNKWPIRFTVAKLSNSFHIQSSNPHRVHKSRRSCQSCFCFCRWWQIECNNWTRDARHHQPVPWNMFVHMCLFVLGASERMKWNRPSTVPETRPQNSKGLMWKRTLCFCPTITLLKVWVHKKVNRITAFYNNNTIVIVRCKRGELNYCNKVTFLINTLESRTESLW